MGSSLDRLDPICYAWGMATNERNKRRLIDRVWMRDGTVVHTGTAVSLAMLMHVKGQRGSNEETEIRRLLNDQNLDD